MNEEILKRLEGIEARADNPWCDKWIGGLALDDTPWLCELVRKLLAVAEAAREALQWFQEFGYNSWGIAVQDDFPDHEPILWSLKASLTALEEEDGE